jgi:hypothetical protein
MADPSGETSRVWWERHDVIAQRVRRLDRGILVLAVVFLAAFPLLFKPWIHGFDTVAYYSWLRTAVIDGDLDVGNEFEHFGYGSERQRTSTGHTYNEWAVGSAILWAPLYLIAHGLSLIAQGLGFAVPADGLAPQYVWAISLSSSLYAFVGLLLTYSLCRAHFSVSVSVLATVAVWLSGTLVFYMYSHPAMSHANDAFAFALFAYTWYRTRESTAARSQLLRGASAGLCALVRLSTSVFVLAVIAEYAAEGLREWRAGKGTAALVDALGRVALVSIAWWIVFSPQVVVWRVALGKWIILNPYAGGAGVTFDLLHPSFLPVLFSTDRGLFVWTPLMAPAVAGLALLWRRAPRQALLLVVCFLAQFYVVAAWGVWSGAAAYGQRFFTNMAPTFALGLAALLAALEPRIALRWLAAVCCLFIIWNGLLIVRYVIDDVSHMRPVPLGELVSGQFTVLPRHFRRIVQAILTRQ